MTPEQIRAIGLAKIESGLSDLRQAEQELREALEHVLDVWPAPSPEEFARLHRVLTGHDSCDLPCHEGEG